MKTLFGPSPVVLRLPSLAASPGSCFLLYGAALYLFRDFPGPRVERVDDDRWHFAAAQVAWLGMKPGPNYSMTRIWPEDGGHYIGLVGFRKMR